MIKSKITGVIKQKTEVIVIDDDSDSDDDSDDDDVRPPKMVKRDYDSSDSESDDNDDDVSSQGVVEEEIEAEAASGEPPQVQQLGRGQREKKQRTHYVPGT